MPYKIEYNDPTSSETSWYGILHRAVEQADGDKVAIHEMVRERSEMFPKLKYRVVHNGEVDRAVHFQGGKEVMREMFHIEFFSAIYNKWNPSRMSATSTLAAAVKKVDEKVAQSPYYKGRYRVMNSDGDVVYDPDKPVSHVSYKVILVLDGPFDEEVRRVSFETPVRADAETVLAARRLESSTDAKYILIREEVLA